MGSAFLLCVVVALMFVGGQCDSVSKSCSYVNGKMQCDEQRSDGNFAASSALSGTGGSGDYQKTAAGTGDTGSGSFSSSSTSTGNVPPGFNPFVFVPGFGYGPQQRDDSGNTQAGFNPFAFVPGFGFPSQQQPQQPTGDEPPRANPNPFGYGGGFAYAGPGVAVGAGQGFNPFEWVFGRR